jgi:hypothetical protein
MGIIKRFIKWRQKSYDDMMSGKKNDKMTDFTNFVFGGVGGVQAGRKVLKEARKDYKKRR